MAHIDEVDIRRLDGSLLLVFRELLRTRSATEAAGHLHLSQSAVSHALGRLRSIYHDQLFVRRSHGFEPTKRALELGPRIEALVDLAAETMRGEVSFNPSQTERRFSLGVPQFLTALVGAPLATAMRRRAPRASFHVQHLEPSSALDLLRRGEIDLALGRFGDLRRDGLDIEKLYEDRYCVVARKRHPVLKGAIDVEQYTGIGHVLAVSASEGDPAETLPEPLMIATTAIVPGWVSALLVVASSDVISTCPRRLAESQAGTLNLQVLDLPFDFATFAVSAARRSDGTDEGVDWLLEQVRDCVR